MTDKPLQNGFVAVGDIMLGDSAPCVGFGFHSRYPRDATPAFARVGPQLRRGSIVLGNLECLLSQKERGLSRQREGQMRGDPEYALALRSAGFTALALANNHAMQHGISAFEETVAALTTAGIACVGLRGTGAWCAEPVIQTTTEGLRVGLLGYCWRPRQYEYSTPPYAEGDVDAAERDVRRLQEFVDAVIVSLHWGEEFLTVPSTAEVAAARRIVDAGAAVVAGHHPHVLRPAERYGRGVICYSLGNFVSDMIWQPTLRLGTILECELEKSGVRDARLLEIRVDDSFVPIPQSSYARPHEGLVAGMPESAYHEAAERSVRRQQLAAYMYAARNIFRYNPGVFIELVTSTIWNKLSSAIPSVTAWRR